MNCDQVFDVLTRGPFPTNTSCDTPVEAHLDRCPECRRLAEALRPALELFQESVGPEESRDLPGYWCAVATDRKQPVVSYAEEHLPRRTAPRAWARGSLLARHWSAVTVWRMAAMLALGATLGSLVGSRVTFDGRSSLPPTETSIAAPVPPKGGSVQLSLGERTQLAVLPAACFRNRPASAPRYTERGDQMLATADLANIHCCSECHNVNSDAVPGAATVKVAQHCQICHNDRHGR